MATANKESEISKRIFLILGLSDWTWNHRVCGKLFQSASLCGKLGLFAMRKAADQVGICNKDKRTHKRMSAYLGLSDWTWNHRVCGKLFQSASLCGKLGLFAMRKAADSRW